jgi:hypothetical protein
MRYELKTWPKLFSAILANFKRHEIPVNDRDFREGDELFLEGIAIPICGPTPPGAAVAVKPLYSRSSGPRVYRADRPRARSRAR